MANCTVGDVERYEADEFNNDRDFDALADLFGVRIFTNRPLLIPVAGEGKKTDFSVHKRPERKTTQGFALGTFTLDDSAPLELLHEIALKRNAYITELAKIALDIKATDNDMGAFFKENALPSERFLSLLEYVESHTLKIERSDIEKVYEEKRGEREREISAHREASGTTFEVLRRQNESRLSENDRLKKSVMEEERARKWAKLMRSRFPAKWEFQVDWEYSAFLDRFYEHYKDEINKRFAHKNNVKTVAGELEDWKAFTLQNRPVASKFFFRPIGFYIPFRAFDTHAYITGESGSGKSELLKLIAHEILSARTGELFEKGNLLFIDPHGDLAEEIVRLNDAWDGETPRFEYFKYDLFEGESPIIDLFFSNEGETDNQLDKRASHLFEAFNEIIDDATISMQMRALLVPCLNVLLRRKGSTLADLQRFMQDEKNGDLIEAGKGLSNVLQAKLFLEGGFTSKQYDTTKRSLFTRLQSLLNSNVFRRVTSSREVGQVFLNVEECLNGNKSVIFNLASGFEGEIERNAFGRLILAQIRAFADFREKTPKHLRKHSHIIIDECQNFIGETLIKALTEFRKFGFRLIFANQIVGQRVNSETKDIYLSNTGVKIAGHNGEKSMNILASAMGANIDEMRKLVGGRFMVKIKPEFGGDHTKPFVFRVDSTLASGRRSMSEKEFREKKEALRGIYADNKAIDNTWNKPKMDEGKGDRNFADSPKNEIGGDRGDRIKPKFKL